jgi:hypothetical protein
VLYQPLVESDDVKWRLARQDATTVLNRTTQGDIVRVPTLSRVVRRSDDVWQVEKRLSDAELAVAYRFDPPGIDAGSKARVPDQVVIQWPFLHDLAAGQVDENGILFHAAKLGGPDQAASGPGERRTDQ